MIKALFFDIDGTLVSFRTHKIPQSTVEAITMAKNMGIKVYISTGRPRQLIDNINEISHLVDGYITVNGAYCFEGEEIISFHPIPEANVRKVLSLADEMNFACMVVGKNDLVVYHDNESADRIFLQMLNVRGLSEDVPVESVLEQSVLQLTPVISQEDEKLIMPSLPDCTSCRWHPDFADVTMKVRTRVCQNPARLSLGVKRAFWWLLIVCASMQFHEALHGDLTKRFLSC